MNRISVNGNIVEQASALVHVDERGFRFGDGVFETIPVHASVPYLWEYHAERLKKGLAALGIALPASGLKAQTIELLRANQVKEGIVRLYVSRGVGSQGYLPSPDITPTTIIIQTLNPPSTPADAVALWHSAVEKISPRALPTEYKLAQGINSILGRMEAQKQGCYDALQLSANGHIAEASSANIFWLTAGKLYTPSLATGALAGVTRRRIIELSPYPVEEGNYTLDILLAARAVILTNATLGIVPVKTLNPHDAEWKSEALAHEFIKLRNQDIAEYIKRFPEVLA